MIDALIAIIQLAAAVFLLWGACICVGFRDRRRHHHRTAHAQRRRSDRQPGSALHLVDLADEAADRATDFSIGFRTASQPLKRAA